MHLSYKTILVVSDGIILPFYKYNNGVGYVPGEVVFNHRGKIFSTTAIMTLLAELIEKKNKRPFKTPYKMTDWYQAGEFQKEVFIAMQNGLEKAAKPRR